MTLNKINDRPKSIREERAFLNDETNLLKETYPFVYNTSISQLFLPKVPNEDEVKSSLLLARPFVVRIAVLYVKEAEIHVAFGSGCSISNDLVLTCAHLFDPIVWSETEISYSKILVAVCDPCPERYFSLLDMNTRVVFSAEILQRGLAKENLTKYTELQNTDTDLALLRLNKPIADMKDLYFDPKLNGVSLNTLPLKSNLYMVGYNGKLAKQNQLEAYQF